MSSERLVARNLVKHFGAACIIDDVSLEIAPGEIVALLGPSGCGKTTTLRCLAGLEVPDEGSIAIGERDVFDASRGLVVPPEKRRVGMMFQSYAIWPHMTIFENVAYGLRVQKVAAAEIATRVHEALAAVNLADMAKRFPATLSGGEQQRVALARSMVTQPGVLLMDEPLSNLDLKLRERMRLELRDVLKQLGVTAIYVTHDQSDAMVLADRLAIMNAGRIVEDGAPRSVYEKPRTQFASEFLGTANVVVFTQILSEGERHFGCFADGRRIALDERPRGLCHIIRPERIRIVGPVGAAGDSTLEGRIEKCVYMGNLTYYTVKSGALSLLVQSSEGDLGAGSEVRVELPPSALVHVAP